VGPKLVYDAVAELMTSQNWLVTGNAGYSTNRYDESFLSLNLLESEIL
jgi:hypothetical protein